MELRQLRYFLSAVKHLSFTKAAEECCIVQSAMSQQIHLLEKELGVPLFERTKRGLVLTPAGQLVAREARQLLDKAEAMQAAVRQAGAQSTLRLGCQGRLLNLPLSRALASMRTEAPDAHVSIKTGFCQSLLEQLRNGQLDAILALYGQPLTDADWVDIRPLAQERVFIMLPAASPLAGRDAIDPESLVGETLILYTSELHNNALNDLLNRNGAYPRRLYADSDADIEMMVAAGYGVSFCAGSAVRPHPDIAFREAVGLPRLQSCLAWRKGSPSEQQIQMLTSFLLMHASELNSVF